MELYAASRLVRIEKTPIHSDYPRYEGGSRIERMRAKPQQHHGIGIRYDKTTSLRELPQKRCSTNIPKSSVIVA